MDRRRAGRIGIVVHMELPLTSRFLLLCLILASPAGHAQARTVRSHDSVFAAVLIYHHVKWLKPSDDAIERGLTVLPSQFQAQLSYLAASHYRPVTALQLVGYLRDGLGLPGKPVVLTFDDGYTDIYRTAYPLLRRYHMTATFFIVPGFLDTPRYLTWTQVEDMARHGMDIEAHTLGHPDLTMVQAAQAWNEISGSRRELEARLRRSVHLFAFPYGDFNAAVLRDVARAGYWAAFTTREGWQPSRAQLLTLPRVYVDLDDTLQIFAGRLRADPSVLAQDPT